MCIGQEGHLQLREIFALLYSQNEAKRIESVLRGVFIWPLVVGAESKAMECILMRDDSRN